MNIFLKNFPHNLPAMYGAVCAILIAGMCIISGCREKFAESFPSDGQVKVFVDSVESDNTSRTALAADGSVQWIMQDKLIVFDKDFKGVQFSTTADYNASAVFTSAQWTGKTPVSANGCFNAGSYYIAPVATNLFPRTQNFSHRQKRGGLHEGGGHRRDHRQAQRNRGIFVYLCQYLNNQ